MLYRVAVETGLRRGELASLTRTSFALEGDHPTVTVEAASSKHRRRDVLPLRPDTAAALKAFFGYKLPAAAAFTVPTGRHDTVDMFRADLAAGREAWPATAATADEREKREVTSFLAYVDSAGRYADFHSLRHTCDSLLAASGVHPKVAQTIMRHCTIDLTMSRYTHVFHGQEQDAVAALPNLSSPARKTAAATGTDGRHPGDDDFDDPNDPNGRRRTPSGDRGHSAETPKNLERNLGSEGGFRGFSEDSGGSSAAACNDDEIAGIFEETRGKSALQAAPGRVSERPKEPVLKTGVRVSVPWVRIPPLPFQLEHGPTPSWPPE